MCTGLELHKVPNLAANPVCEEPDYEAVHVAG